MNANNPHPVSDTLWQARDPSTPSAELRDLARLDPEHLTAVVRNPSVPAALLAEVLGRVERGGGHHDLVLVLLENPLFPVLLLETPSLPFTLLTITDAAHVGALAVAVGLPWTHREALRSPFLGALEHLAVHHPGASALLAMMRGEARSRAMPLGGASTQHLLWAWQALAQVEPPKRELERDPRYALPRFLLDQAVTGALPLSLAAALFDGLVPCGVREPAIWVAVRSLCG